MGSVSSGFAAKLTGTRCVWAGRAQMPVAWLEGSVKDSPHRLTLVPGVQPGLVEHLMHFAPPVDVSHPRFRCHLSDF